MRYFTLLTIAVAYSTCGHNPPTDPQKPASGCGAASSVTPPIAASVSVTPPVTVATPRTAKFHPDAECAQRAQGSTRDQLKFIEDNCLRSSAKIAEKSQMQASPNQQLIEKLSLDSFACLRIALVSTPPTDVKVTLLDSNATPIQSLDDSTPLAFPNSGPLCVTTQGQYTLSISPKSQSTLDWSVWVTSPSNHTK